ncbi:uncharacterized protein LOC143252767 isoform X7 [Tachypleus tridentatus]|uniref:uncharacterized protein LOC143252767 isoform X7 n=1 Tax=Tachypleus tridentatus TaxID=6853 RepID=UPI003FD23F4D
MVTEDQRQADVSASFLRAARAGNLEKVLEFLKGNIDINTSNANGLNALHLASKEGHVNIVSELIKRGANVNAATKKGNTSLHIASLAGQEAVVKLLVQSGANVNVQSQNGFTPLYMAAQENHHSVVCFLLTNGANQSLATEDGFTPLAVSLQQGHDKVVTVLLENDAKGRVRLPALHIAAKKDDCKAAALLLQNDHNPDVTSKSGFTPLHIAAHYGNDNIGRLLLEKSAKVNHVAKHQITPLHVASKWGKSNMVMLLLEKGAQIGVLTKDGLTPLHCAARSGHDQVVDLLLERGAPVTAKTKNGLAPLHMASQGDNVDCARTLLYHKAPVDDVTIDYLTALHVAAHCGHVKVAKILLDHKADPNARALNGFTPLHIACKKNRLKIVELLLKHGGSIEARTESGLTPLHVSAFMGNMNIVIFLIQHGADPDIPTVRGETPIHLAARANQADIIRILLRNGAHVDAKAREHQTPLHIAARLGNVDIVSLLIQHGAAVDATSKDMYTALHIAAKEGQEEVASLLLDNGASLTATTKKGFTALHLTAKYGNIKVARLLLQRNAPVDVQGKNGVTPLHVATHYDNVNVALLLVENGASPHTAAKNGYTPLHIAAKHNQMDIATTLLEYGAKANAESKTGFTPLHLASQEGHTDMTTLLIEHDADVNAKAKNGLTPLHLCAQEDLVNIATILVKNDANVDSETNAGYSPLHVACHFGQVNMVRFLLQHRSNVTSVNSHGYTPLHQAAQQGHALIVNLLLEHKASPNVLTKEGQTALAIAKRLGYISVVETLKVVTENSIIPITSTVTEEKYKVIAPEIMQESFMSDSEDEGGEEIEESTLFGTFTNATHVYLPYYEGKKFQMREDTILGDQSLHYLTADEMKSLGDDSLPIDVTKDERTTDSMLLCADSGAPLTVDEDHLSPLHVSYNAETTYVDSNATDNIDMSRAPFHASKLKWKMFLVSFMVDARGGAMRGCRQSGVRVIIPPRKASMPMRITCRYLRKEKLIHPPPLMEGEACAARILEVGPVGAKFLGPIIIEIPHFTSLRGKEREIIILRSDNGEVWQEHTTQATEEAVQDILNESFKEEINALEDLNADHITRIVTTDFPQYFAIVSRVRQEVCNIGPEGGIVSSTVVPQVQAIFPEGALTKKIKVGLQAHPVVPELVSKMLGNRVGVSPIVTIEPRRRKFHKPITLTIPVPQTATKGMINQYSGNAPTLRLLCSISGDLNVWTEQDRWSWSIEKVHNWLSSMYEYTFDLGGFTKAQWEDVTGSTPLTCVNDCVSFTTTVSARFWLMDCRHVNEVGNYATELYREVIYVPFMVKFVVFAKRYQTMEAELRVFCMTDDKKEKTLEIQENFTEIAKSRDVEVLEGKPQFLELAGNLVPVTKAGEQLTLSFQPFKENRLPFIVRVKDPDQDPVGRIAFMREPRVGRGEPPQTPICNLNIALPDICKIERKPVTTEVLKIENKYDFIQKTGPTKLEHIQHADLHLSDIAQGLNHDWIQLAGQLDVPKSDVNSIKKEHPNDMIQQALVMLRLWIHRSYPKATGNSLEKALREINREDIVNRCMVNVKVITDDVKKAVNKVHLDQSGFDTFKDELGSSRDISLKRDTVHAMCYDEQDIMKETELAEEVRSKYGSAHENQLSLLVQKEQEDLGELPSELKVDSEQCTTTTSRQVSSSSFPENKQNELAIISMTTIAQNKPNIDLHTEENEHDSSVQHPTLTKGGTTFHVDFFCPAKPVYFQNIKQSPLSSPSLIPTTSYHIEQELSPAADYPVYLVPEMQVFVDISPKESSEMNKYVFEHENFVTGMEENISSESTHEFYAHNAKTPFTKICSSPFQNLYNEAQKIDYTDEDSISKNCDTDTFTRNEECVSSKVTQEETLNMQLPESSKTPEKDISYQKTLNVYENTAFTRVDVIDKSAVEDENFERSTNTYKTVGKTNKELSAFIPVTNTIGATQGEQEIYSHFLEQSIHLPIEEGLLFSKFIPETTTSVEHQIKSQIFSEELDKSIEENTPEKKNILEGKHIKPTKVERVDIVTKQIRSAILAHELSEDTENDLPEEKDIPYGQTKEKNLTHDLCDNTGSDIPEEKAFPCDQGKEDEISETYKASFEEKIEREGNITLNQVINILKPDTEKSLNYKENTEVLEKEFAKEMIGFSRTSDKEQKTQCSSVKHAILETPLQYNSEQVCEKEKELREKQVITEHNEKKDFEESVNENEQIWQSKKLKEEFNEDYVCEGISSMKEDATIVAKGIIEDIKTEMNVCQLLKQSISEISGEDFTENIAEYIPILQVESSLKARDKLEEKKVTFSEDMPEILHKTISENEQSYTENEDENVKIKKELKLDSKTNGYGCNDINFEQQVSEHYKELTTNANIETKEESMYISGEHEDEWFPVSSVDTANIKMNEIIIEKDNNDHSSLSVVNEETKDDQILVPYDEQGCFTESKFSEKAVLNMCEKEYLLNDMCESKRHKDSDDIDMTISDETEGAKKETKTTENISDFLPETLQQIRETSVNTEKKNIEVSESSMITTQNFVKDAQKPKSITIHKISKDTHKYCEEIITNDKKHKWQCSDERSDLQVEDLQEDTLTKGQTCFEIAVKADEEKTSKSDKPEKLSSSPGVEVASSDLSSTSKTKKHLDKNYEIYSSSGETDSHYHTFRMSESGRTSQGTSTTSQPCSSEFDANTYVAPISSGYDTCATSPEVSGSYATVYISKDTAYSSRSQSSLDSESSEHLTSVEKSSVTSETLVPSVQEFQRNTETTIIEEEEMINAFTPKEPYDLEIPEAIIRGGMEIPFLKAWKQNQSCDSSYSNMFDDKSKISEMEEAPSSPFEIITKEELEDYPVDYLAFVLQTEQLHNNKEGITFGSNIIDGCYCSEGSAWKGKIYREEQDVTDSVHDLTVNLSCKQEELFASESSATLSKQTWFPSSDQNSIQTSEQQARTFVENRFSQDQQVRFTVLHNFTQKQSSTFDSCDEVFEQEPEMSPHLEGSVFYPQVTGSVEVRYIPEYDTLGKERLQPESTVRPFTEETSTISLVTNESIISDIQDTLEKTSTTEARSSVLLSAGDGMHVVSSQTYQPQPKTAYAVTQELCQKTLPLEHTVSESESSEGDVHYIQEIQSFQETQKLQEFQEQEYVQESEVHEDEETRVKLHKFQNINQLEINNKNKKLVLEFSKELYLSSKDDKLEDNVDSQMKTVLNNVSQFEQKRDLEKIEP